MVTVHMRDKHFVNALHLHLELAHLHLRPFTTVDQKKLIMDVEHLCRRTVLSGWGRSTAT
jgi:hypothetical protein